MTRSEAKLLEQHNSELKTSLVNIKAEHQDTLNNLRLVEVNHIFLSSFSLCIYLAIYLSIYMYIYPYIGNYFIYIYYIICIFYFVYLYIFSPP